MTFPNPGPASQNSANIAGGPYGAWNNSAGTGLIGPTGNIVSLGTGVGGGVALFDGANSITSGTAQFSNANGVSFGFNAQTITGSVASQTVQTQASGAIAGSGFTSATTAGTAIVGSNNSAGLSIGVPKFITTFNQTTQSGISSVADSANTQTIGMVSFANSNGVTFGISTGANTATITASVVAGNPGISGIADGAHTQTVGTVSFVNSNGVTFGISTGANTGTLTASIANYAGTGSTFAGANISGSMTLNSAGVNLSLSRNPDSTYVSYYELQPLRGLVTISNAFNLTNTSVMNLSPFVVQGQPISFYRGMFINSYLSNRSTYSYPVAVSESQGSTASTCSFGTTGTIALFSRVSTGTNANSSNLSWFLSSTFTQSMGIYGTNSIATNASTGTATATTAWSMGFVQNIDSTGGLTTSSQGSSGSTSFSSTTNAASTFTSSFVMSQQHAFASGMRPVYFPFAQSLSPGEYWFGLQINTNTGTTGGPILNSLGSYSMLPAIATTITQPFYMFGSSSTVSNLTGPQWIGSVSSAQSTTTIGSSMLTFASAVQTWFNLMAQTL